MTQLKDKKVVILKENSTMLPKTLDAIYVFFELENPSGCLDQLDAELESIFGPVCSHTSSISQSVGAGTIPLRFLTKLLRMLSFGIIAKAQSRPGMSNVLLGLIRVMVLADISLLNVAAGTCSLSIFRKVNRHKKARPRKKTSGRAI